MKLYATVTSERASKGQGGNEYLDIDIMVGNTKNPVMLAQLTVRPTDEIEKYTNNADDKGHGFILVDDNDNVIAWWNENIQELGTLDDIKGKRQKGDELDIAFHRVNADER